MTLYELSWAAAMQMVYSQMFSDQTSEKTFKKPKMNLCLVMNVFHSFSTCISLEKAFSYLV